MTDNVVGSTILPNHNINFISCVSPFSFVTLRIIVTIHIRIIIVHLYIEINKQNSLSGFDFVYMLLDVMSYTCCMINGPVHLLIISGRDFTINEVPIDLTRLQWLLLKKTLCTVSAAGWYYYQWLAE